MSKRKAPRRPYVPPAPLRRERRFPLATIVYYGPDDQIATKVVVAVFAAPRQMVELRRWTVDDGDIRYDDAVLGEMRAFSESHGVVSSTVSEIILGCPHEEGVDYPVGEACPQCPYWANRDRWTGEIIEPGG